MAVGQKGTHLAPAAPSAFQGLGLRAEGQYGEFLFPIENLIFKRLLPRKATLILKDEAQGPGPYGLERGFKKEMSYSS